MPTNVRWIPIIISASPGVIQSNTSPGCLAWGSTMNSLPSRSLQNTVIISGVENDVVLSVHVSALQEITWLAVGQWESEAVALPQTILILRQKSFWNPDLQRNELRENSYHERRLFIHHWELVFTFFVSVQLVIIIDDIHLWQDNLMSSAFLEKARYGVSMMWGTHERTCGLSSFSLPSVKSWPLDDHLFETAK